MKFLNFRVIEICLCGQNSVRMEFNFGRIGRNLIEWNFSITGYVERINEDFSYANAIIQIQYIERISNNCLFLAVNFKLLTNASIQFSAIEKPY